MELDISQILIESIMGLLYIIPTMAFIIISIYYLSKMGSQTDGIFILIGNIIIFLAIVIGRILWIQLVFYQKWQGGIYSYISTVISIFSVLGSILFAIGTFLLVKRILQIKTLT